jgi:hypothetical protein
MLSRSLPRSVSGLLEYGASIPWGRIQADGVTVVPARRVPDQLEALPPILGADRIAWLANRARLRFRP